MRKGTITFDRLAPSVRKRILKNAAAKPSTSSSVVGTPGPAGAKGDTGAPGRDGANGSNGANGAQGPRGYNADGTITAKVTKSGDAGVTVGSTSRTDTGNSDAVIDSTGLHITTDATGGDTSGAIFPVPAGTTLSDLRALTLSFTKHGGASAVAPYLAIDIKNAHATAGGTVDTRLFFEPVYTLQNKGDGEPQNTVTYKLDTLGANNGWWANDQIVGDPVSGANAMPVPTFQAIATGNADATVTSIRVMGGMNAAGPPWQSFDASVEYVNLGFAGGDVTHYVFG